MLMVSSSVDFTKCKGIPPYSYNDINKVLDGFSFEIGAGENVGIMGESACGKVYEFEDGHIVGMKAR